MDPIAVAVGVAIAGAVALFIGGMLLLSRWANARHRRREAEAWVAARVEEATQAALARSSSATPEDEAPASAPVLATVDEAGNLQINADGSFDQEIVGESHYQPALERAAGGRTGRDARQRVVAELVLEDENPHDCNAVRVDVDGATVGYFSRADAPLFRMALRQKFPDYRRQQRIYCQGKIRGGGKLDGGGWKSYGLWLDFPFE